MRQAIAVFIIASGVSVNGCSAVDDAATKTHRIEEVGFILDESRFIGPQKWKDGKLMSEEEFDDLKKDLARRFRSRISIDFQNTPLSEAIGFLRIMMQAGMIVDPQGAEGGPVTLKADNAPMGEVLEKILQQAGLDYAFYESAIYITTPERLKELRAKAGKAVEE